MSERVEKIIELAKSQNISNLKTRSTDAENSLKTEEFLEWQTLYEGVEEKELREDRMYLLEFIEKIERSHGKDSRAKKVLVDALVFLENKKAD